MNKTIKFPFASVTLNPEQYDVVTAESHLNQRILASAGSGKTTTITSRIAWLLTQTHISAEQIILLTFSRNSANDMLKRVHKLVGPVSLWAGTFHALANTVLREMGESGATSQMLFIDELPVRWMQWMRTTKGREWVGKIRYLVVDEFQDINAIQWRLLETIRHPGCRSIIVGDDAQNIYTWRGSSAGFLLDYHKTVLNVKDYQLRMNYRSTDTIVNVANRVMRGIPTLPWKEHMVANKKGNYKPEVLFFWRVNDEYSWIAKKIQELKSKGGTFAVLARNNIELYRAEEIFVHHGLRTRFLNEGGEDPKEGIVDLATFHGSKGLEWDTIFLISLSDDVIPSRKSPFEIIGERRLFYVAVTRARERMFFTYHGNERTLSRFVREIGYKSLVFHGLAKYALSEYEVGFGVPNLQSLLDCLDGDEWQTIRKMGILPWNDTLEYIPIVEKKLFPPGETFKIPSWADTKDFEAFVKLWSKRCLLELRGWQEEFKDPVKERMIFTIRIFQEDKAFWEQWREEFEAMVRHYFADTKRMDPVAYGDIAEWSETRGLGWSQKEIVEATTLIAKLRGQMRCLRFETYSLDEFKIGPTNCVVPTEYRLDCLRSWRRFIRKDLSWRDCLLDIWRLACLDQVADGRHAGLYRASTMVDLLDTCIPYLEVLERVLISAFDVTCDLTMNPEFHLEEISPVSMDFLCGSTIIRMCGEKKPDYYMWVESWLMAYTCFACTNENIKRIQIMHPFHGLLWEFNSIDLVKAKILYEVLLKLWSVKQS
jgi:hypothetical protein